jgi:hypothetical protein
MMHMAYPNVGDKQFIGCGRYVSQLESPVEKNRVYSKAEPGGIRSKIGTAMRRLVPEWDRQKHKAQIWECRDQPQHYAGPSLELAYLLATIRCVRRLLLDAYDSLGDLWCTGQVALVGDNNQPFLNDVYQDWFKLKLQAFVNLQARDRLFLVPAANLTDDLTKLCREHEVRVLHLRDFSRVLGLRKFRKILRTAGEEKLIVTIDGEELPLLVRALFQSSPLTGPSWRTMAVLGGLIFLALGIGLLILSPPRFQPQLRAIEEQVSSPPLVYPESGLRHSWSELTPQQKRLAQAIKAAENTFEQQHGHYIPVQDTTISQMMQTVGATAHDKDFVVERMQFHSNLDRLLKRTDAFVERVSRDRRLR